LIGDSIKTLPKAVKTKLINIDNHQAIQGMSKTTISYSEITYKGRRIICSYSAKRARKDAYAREKRITKAKQWLEEPSKYSDLFEVEPTFRALKSQLEIRPVFHWTDKRIRGHIPMCFTAFTFINHLKTQPSFNTELL
jgi:hypothetical protein